MSLVGVTILTAILCFFAAGVLGLLFDGTVFGFLVLAAGTAAFGYATFRFGIFRCIRRVRARYAPYSLENLTSRILVTDGLTPYKLKSTKDRTEPLSRERVAAEYPELYNGPEPRRGRDPGRMSEA